MDKYPIKEFDRLWKLLLINQFHDIIPGSSIHRVYEDAIPQLKSIVADCKRLQNDAAMSFMKKDENMMTLFNPSSTAFSGTIKLPEGWKTASLNGVMLDTQREADDYVARVEVAPRGFIVLELSKDEPASASTQSVGNEMILENEEVKYVFNSQFQVVFAIDKTNGFEFVTKDNPANMLRLFDDRPAAWDAWDYDEYVDNAQVASPEIISIEKISGPVRNGIMAYMKIGTSMCVQTAWLEKTGKRLDFVSDINWTESHKMLRVEFPVNVKTQEANFEIQYGTISRATHNNTKWQYAQYEVVGHRFADMSEYDFGVALLNDSKYGYRAKNGVMSLSLLRSPTWPDPICDVGQHHIVYSLLPHAGCLKESGDIVRANASMINQGLEKFIGMRVNSDACVPVSFDGEGVELAVIKRAEKEDCLVVRLVETRGRRASGTLTTTIGNKFIECQTSEWNSMGSPISTPAKIEFRPFEIKTFKVK